MRSEVLLRTNATNLSAYVNLRQFSSPAQGVSAMADRILVFYGSYRADRKGIRLAQFIVTGLAARGALTELIDAKSVNLPMLDRMYKEHTTGTAPPAMEALAGK
ncbi:MAG TPA: NAD(P)H-dependent oxidoreductase, partial [Steroidobacteraceae bacterium]